ncbi:PIN domain-containing protein [Promethearchaeum syntrophicum]|uniref:PIN domain-containing protein n=1 Tax=Promethearchaeum syntrophicum TaxID=2594042 RepID=A0A5B9D9P6_9ARCH|nr:PIN domain-containing protein [Candidatus Prometheoarchaeum syntrophicum]QEE15675.1 PIN domain protein [Candidatus Prometheoarchaeum syntrophicum]
MTNSLLLDTTYVLPLFGIEINMDNSFREEIKQLWKIGVKNYKIYLSSASIIESVYKLNREYRNSKNPEILDRYHTVLPTIIRSKIVKIIDPFLNPVIAESSMKIRNYGHKDLMDCWIAASAISINALLLTEDKELKNLLRKFSEFKFKKILDWKMLRREF